MTGASVFMRALVGFFAVLGLLLSVLFVVGLAMDVADSDRTKGGYEPPYTEYSGTPIDWDETDITPTGMVRRGYVSNTLFNCTSGMIHIQLFGQLVPFRKFSERAIAVHKPRQACTERGFSPEF